MPMRVAPHAVADKVIQDARDIQPHPVGQMAAMCQVQTEDRVAGPERGQIHGQVRLRSGMGLDVGVLRAEQASGSLDGQLLDHIDVFAAAVVAPARIAFGILVG